ncbi:Decaprenyl diphosphate synthase-like protein [Biscogniauxia mediterranea]|nr:Decaprenyl diphosphate synthase-like protein [Biscogniauxia mediterranea]KAI1634206.1 Decaprenyl diphosphate synthase-like protein [Biscogniauxia mediterranea]
MSDLYLSHIRNWFWKSPPAEWLMKGAREVLIGTLKQGPIPKHVAFEMDGNRRFAKNHQIETVEGHHLGFEALARVLEICYKCGVKVVTVYAFSIENFNRPRHEVKGLMTMAKVKLEQLIQHGELLDRYGAGIRVSGERDLIPDDVLPFVDRAIEMTKHNKDAILNICFPYTSRAEMTSAIKATVDEYAMPSRPPNPPFSQSRITQKIRSNQSKKSDLPSIRESSPDDAAKSDDVDDSMSSTTALDPESPPLQSTPSRSANFKNPETITAETINSHMYTAEFPPLDIFIRTSGVMRLSDFMLWQCHENTHIFFLDCLWPEFDLGNFVPVLLEWQWRQKKLLEKEGTARR